MYALIAVWHDGDDTRARAGVLPRVLFLDNLLLLRDLPRALRPPHWTPTIFEPTLLLPVVRNLTGAVSWGVYEYGSSTLAASKSEGRQ
jgi:hypothetical protein